MRTKAQWEKQQQAAAAAAAAMCYWGYSEQNPLMFTKNDWRQMNADRTNPSNHPPASTTSTIDNGQIHIPRCVEQTAHTSKAVREPR